MSGMLLLRGGRNMRHKFIEKLPQSNANRRVLIDGDNLCWQVFFGIGSELTAGGQRTDITFGFLRRILNLAEQLDTSHFIFCWDSRDSIRKRISPKYKRKRIEDDPKKIAQKKQVSKQMKFIREVILPGLGLNNSFMIDGYEADDIIAFIVLEEHGRWYNFIASTDDDFKQCLGYFTSIYNLKKKKIFSYEDFKKHCGNISPWFWAEAKAIGGCNSDGVLGVSGVADPAKSKSSDVPVAIKYLKGELKKGKIYDRINSIEMQRRISKNRFLVHLPLRPKSDDSYFNFYRSHIVFSDDDISVNKLSRIFGKYQFYSFLKQDMFDRWKEVFCPDHLKASETLLRKVIPRKGGMKSLQKTKIMKILS